MAIAKLGSKSRNMAIQGHAIACRAFICHLDQFGPLQVCNMYTACWAWPRDLCTYFTQLNVFMVSAGTVLCLMRSCVSSVVCVHAGAIGVEGRQLRHATSCSVLWVLGLLYTVVPDGMVQLVHITFTVTDSWQADMAGCHQCCVISAAIPRIRRPRQHAGLLV